MRAKVSAALKGRKITWGAKIAQSCELAKGGSSLERRVANWFDSCRVKYVRQHIISKMCVDFYLPEFHAVVEVDGRYWHSLPGRPEQDARRDYVLRKMGYSVIRISEAQAKALRRMNHAVRLVDDYFDEVDAS
jgi:very-short-patch-repair endonuclease